ncbi:MAG TPA: homoserine dehydrogenase [Chloroflexota bacterium]|nr:homoserine dehydrogenase [Chloroflexota bacterium]
MSQPLGVGLLGLGTVGSGVARVLLAKNAQLERRIGRPVVIQKVLVRDPSRPRDVTIDVPLVTDPASVVDDPNVDVVIEVLGGEEPARTLILRAIERGKHVVTANKEVMAKHGPAILAAASARGVSVAYEASVGGGIPLIGPFQLDLAANDISSVVGSVNGTTNYILTRMTESGASFASALQEAQELGYAEPDPTNDVEAWDAAYKLAILASLAFDTPVMPEQVWREGITHVSQRDILYAAEMGYRIKLLAIARRVDGQIEARVHPALVHQGSMLASVDGSFNAVQIEGDLIGTALFYGRGAGSEPTSSAVVADLIAVGTSVGRGLTPSEEARQSAVLRPMRLLQTRYFLRLLTIDRPGVMAAIATVLGDRGISLASVVQKESVVLGEDVPGAEIVLTTHLASEAAVQEAITILAQMPVVNTLGSLLRVYE